MYIKFKTEFLSKKFFFLENVVNWMVFGKFLEVHILRTSGKQNKNVTVHKNSQVQVWQRTNSWKKTLE
jgi:hypothetical protein